MLVAQHSMILNSIELDSLTLNQDQFSSLSFMLYSML